MSISLVIPGSIGGIIFILNFLGSTGDIVMVFYLFRTNKNCYVLDTKYGFDIINEVNFR